MMGCAIGDAVGELATIHDDRYRLVGWLNQTERLTYTDETAMMIGVAEAFVLAEQLGLDHQTLFDVVSKSTGQSWALTGYCPVPGPVPARGHPRS